MYQFLAITALMLLLVWYARWFSPVWLASHPIKTVFVLSLPALCTALLLGTSAAEAVSLRFRMATLRFAIGPPPQGGAPSELSLIVGSDDERADLLVRRLPSLFARIGISLPTAPAQNTNATAAPRSNVTVEYLPVESAVSVTGTQNRSVRGVIGVGSAPNLTLIGEIPLRAEDQIQITQASGRLDLKVVDDRTLRSSATGAELELPKLITRLPFLDWPIETMRYPNVRARTYPLDEIVKELSNQPRSQVQDAAERPELTSFLFYKTSFAGFRATLHLALLDTSVAVVDQTGRREYRPQHSLFSVDPATAMSSSPESIGEPSESSHLHFFGLGQNAAGLRSIERLGIRDFRSGRLSVTAGDPPFLVFNLDTPEMLNFTRAQTNELSLAPGSPEEDDETVGRRLYMSLVPEVLPTKAVAFGSLPRVYSAGGQAILEEDREGGLTWRTPSGELKARYGFGSWLGDRYQALIQVDRMEPSLWLLVAILFMGVSLAVFVVLIGPSDRPILVLFSALQVLLAIRFLLSFKAYNGLLASDESYALAFLASVLVPWCLGVAYHVARGNSMANGTAFVHAALLVATIVIALVLVGGGNGLAGSIIAILVYLAAFDRARARASRAATRTRSVLLASTSRVSALGPLRYVSSLGVNITRALFSRVVSSPSGWWAFGAVTLLGVGILVLRIVGVLLGFRERIPIGIPVAISIFYTPLLLTAYALVASLWFHRGYARRDALPYCLSWVVFVGLACFLAGGFASDLGIPLILTWPLLVEFVRTAWSKGHGFKAGAIALLALAAVSVFLWRLTPEPILKRFVAQYDAADWDRNKLLILHYTYPTALPDIGRRDSDNLAIMSQVLGNYTRSGWNGRGYLQAEVTPLLGPTVLREHVPAVFVAGEFGHSGAVLLLAVYLLPLTFYARTHRRPTATGGWRAHFRGVLSELAMATFALSSAYMLLANYDVVPFTGKNMYFLGLDSFGDLIEALILLLIAVVV